MNEFARNKRFQGKWAKEGLRFLRFFGQRPKEFRRYIFYHYLERFLLIFMSIIALALTGIIWLISGPGAAIVTAGAYCLSIGIYRMFRIVIMKRKLTAIKST
jgi:hypothetical protein